MTGSTTQLSVWELARRQHGVVTWEQLRNLGLSRHAIQHRVQKGRLHRVWPRVYAVGRRDLTEEGLWMAAVLTCGEGAVLSDGTAAALWRIRAQHRGPIEITVPASRDPRRRGIRIHRRADLGETTRHRGIPVTDPARTVADLASALTDAQLERAINEADKLDLVHPGELRQAADGKPGAGPKRIRDLLDRQTFVLTRTELERIFVPLAERAGLPRPETQARVNGFDVDFYFAGLGLVVETDGGRFHRTPGQQTRDRLRDQTHLVVGLTPLRFTHAQVRFEPDYVVRTLAALA